MKNNNFFKVLLLLYCTYLGAYDRNNIFVGAGIGLSDNFVDTHTLIPSWYLLGGYEYKPIREASLMAYLESLMGIKPSGLNTNITMQVSLNVDMALELQVSQKMRFGPYVGFGFGYCREERAIVDDGEVNNMALLLLNFGLQSNLDESNVIRLGFKYPFDLKDIRKDMKLVHIFLSYAYKF
ncbi:hypothetical protein CQA57_04650 [Helicobacter anseris]|uniref:Outer membrane beta-barrel protein n=1 Tax=Helicobacter anseris TaxID=375926 RepID=A0A3D8J8S2_9HELI|nr:hypothetical protein [Helicobacter anseris]RDU73595.1 hypothetical protein CQA57_04650 [Helicobacter anseris]